MYYTEEDVQPAVDAAVRIFGPQAQYSPAPYVFVTIKHPRFGKIWYGDVSGDYNTVCELCRRLEAELSEKVMALDTIKFVEIC